MSAKFCVMVRLESGYAVLSVHDRTAWTKRHAAKLARDWKADNMRDAWIEEAQGYETTVRPHVDHFKPFPPVSCAYGAPMGRVSANLDIDLESASPEDLAVAGPAGEYDAGGAYWGCSAKEGPVWAVWLKGRARDGVAYVRAKSRDGAKKAVLAC